LLSAGNILYGIGTKYKLCSQNDNKACNLLYKRITEFDFQI